VKRVISERKAKDIRVIHLQVNFQNDRRSGYTAAKTELTGEGWGRHWRKKLFFAEGKIYV